MKLSKLSRIFKALSNEQRLKLFQLIVKETEKAQSKANAEGAGGCCNGLEKAFTTACGCIDLSKSTISHHFKELQAAGLISCKRVGQAFSCTINEKAVDAVRGFLK